jgi:hypothetical protein
MRHKGANICYHPAYNSVAVCFGVQAFFTMTNVTSIEKQVRHRDTQLLRRAIDLEMVEFGSEVVLN